MAGWLDMWTHREFAGLLGPAMRTWAQGVASRNVSATPRGKPSGRPFHAHFTGVARVAGLHQPVICGSSDHKAWIPEAVGSGAAFIDYDGDGWMDLFLLSGTTLEGSLLPYNVT